MNTRKVLAYGTRNLFFAVAVMFALAFVACDDGSITGDTTPATITYTATQDGGVDGSTTSTGIKFTFSASVDSLNLTAGDITVGGAASIGSATLSGSGTSRTLAPITVNTADLATVSISKTGIEAAQKRVLVYQQGQTAPYWTITWNMNGGDKGAGAYPDLIEKGEVLAKPSPDPIRANSTFGGWYADSGLTQTYNFASPVNTNLILYAKWAVQTSPSDITYTLTQDGGVYGTTTTTGIKFAFSAPVSGLTADDIAVGGDASKGSATLTGSGTSWTLAPITVNNPGLATVSIAKTGIEPAQKTVTVHKEGQPTPTIYTIAWDFNGGIPGAGAQHPTQIVQYTSLAKPTPDPTKAGSFFGGWYSDSGLTQMYNNFGYSVYQDLTLYAKWEGPLTIEAGAGGPYVGYPLNAVYRGSDPVQYYWFKQTPGETINFPTDNGWINATGNAQGKRLNELLTAATYTPTEAGTYILAVTEIAGSALTWASNNVEVIEESNQDPQGPSSFYGTWKTSVQFTPVGENVARHENVYINYNYFFLESTFAGLPSYYGSGDDMEAPFEYAKYKINSWTKLSTVPSGYTHGYRLAVTTVGFKGYSAYSSFEIYQKTYGYYEYETVVFRRTNNNGSAEIGRDYERQNADLPVITPDKPR